MDIGTSPTRPSVVSGYSPASKYLGIYVAPDINCLLCWPGRIFSSRSELKCLYSDLSQIFCSLETGAPLRFQTNRLAVVTPLQLLILLFLTRKLAFQRGVLSVVDLHADCESTVGIKKANYDN